MTDQIQPPAPAGKFRKRPVVVEAYQVPPDDGLTRELPPMWLISAVACRPATVVAVPGGGLDIKTLEGVMRADVGDWIIRGVKGELYPCKPDIFDATYEDAATPAPAPADHATVEQWEAALTAVMPSDFKDWHQNSRREWPNIAAHVIGNLRQREDEAWATVERLTATAPAPATGKPGLQVEQAPAVPTLPAHQRTAPARIYLHDGDDEHTELFPGGMDDGVTWSSDNATGLGVPYVRADLIRSSVAGPSFSSCSAGGCPDKRGCDAAQHCLYTAPQAPQQAECPECIEQARLLGAGGERELALMAEVEQLKCICTSIHDGLLRGADDRELLDLAAQAWDGGKAPQQAELTDEQIYAVDRQVMEGAQTGGYILALCRAVIAEDRALRTPGMGHSSDWTPIDQPPPDGELVAVFWLDKECPEAPERHDLDYRDDGAWQHHFERYEHAVIVGGHGISETPPYTHWKRLGQPDELNAEVTGMQGDVP